MTGPNRRLDGRSLTLTSDGGQGARVARFVSAASNNATVIKSSTGRVLGVSVNNTNAAARYLKFYDKTGTPAPATDNFLLLLVIPLAPSSAVNIAFPGGIKFATGIGVALVTGIGDTDNTSVAANEHSVNVIYD